MVNTANALVDTVLWPCTMCGELEQLGQMFEADDDTWDVFCSACVADYME